MFTKNTVLTFCACALTLFLAACDKAPDAPSIAAGFELEAPANEQQLTEISAEQLLTINLLGPIIGNNVIVTLNGVDITSQLRASDYKVRGILSDFSAQLQQGTNYIDVKDTVSGLAKSFKFYFDDIDPRIQITSISVPSAPGATAAVPGQSVIVSGDIVDVSPVTKIIFTYNLGGVQSVPAAISGTAPNQTFSVTLPYPNRADPAYDPGNPLNPNDTFDSAKHWITAAADFTYSIEDNRGKVTTHRISALESRYKTAAEMFVSYSAFNAVEMFSNATIAELIALVDFSEGGADDPFYRAWLSGDKNAPNIPVGTVIDYSACVANNNCPSQIDMVNVPPSLPPTLSSFLEPIDAIGGSGYCVSSVFDASKVDTCAIYITSVNIGNPTVKLEWNRDSKTPQLDAIVHFPKTVMSIEVAGLRYQPGSGTAEFVPGVGFVHRPGISDGIYTYRGGLRTNVEVLGLELTTGFNVKAGEASQENIGSVGKLLSFSRAPGFKSNLRGHLVKQPLITGTSCTVCKIKAGALTVDIELIEFFYNVGLVRKNGDSIGVGLMGNLEVALDDLLEDPLNIALAGVESVLSLNSFLTTKPGAATPSLQVSVPAATATSEKAPLFLGSYVQGARYRLEGNVAVRDPSEIKAGVTMPIGTEFTTTGGFNDWMFYDKILNKQPVQFAFSLSANVLNQYLTMAHLTGVFDDLVDITFNGDRFTGTDLTVNATDDFALTVETTAAPSVRLIPYVSEQNYGGCVEFMGVGNCKPNKANIITRAEIPEQLAITIPGVKINIENTTLGTPVIEATADITLHVYVRSSRLIPMETFADVFVTSATKHGPVDMALDDKFINAAVASRISIILNSIGADADDLLRLNPRSLDMIGLIGADPSPGTTTSYDIVKSSMQTALPMEVGVSLKVLRVDRGGDFLTMAGNFHPKKVVSCGAAANDYVTTLCVFMGP